MTKPAVMSGCYVDCKFMPGYKVARISIDIPIEHSNAFLQMFGAPDRADPVHVAIARLTPLGTDNPKPEEPQENAKAEAVERKWSRSQKAALKCQDPAFQVWLATKYPAIWDRHYFYLYEARGHHPSPIAADLTLKEVLGITTKRELDTDGHKAADWDALITSFELRDVVR